MNYETSPTHHVHHHSSMIPDKRKTDATEAVGPRTTPNLVCSPATPSTATTEEHAPVSAPSVGGFYARREPLHSTEDFAGAGGEFDEGPATGFGLGSEEPICPLATEATAVDTDATSPPPSPAATAAVVDAGREYVFPPVMVVPRNSGPTPTLRHRPSHSEDNAAARANNGSSPAAFSATPLRHGGGMRFRSHSISITDPVCRSTYESLVQSPAVSFLAQFAQADDWKNRLSLEDGSKVDKYRVGRILGRGSFSECREAESAADSPAAGERVAMKIVKGGDTSDGDRGQNLEDFDRELAIWSRLCHRNILPLLDYLRLDNALVAISPIAENGTLLDYLSKHGPFPEEEAKKLFRQVCQAIAHMHTDRGIVHHDIKLDNILLDRTLKPYICDFGLSETLVSLGGGKEQKNRTCGDRVDLLSSLDVDDQSTSSASKARTEDDIYCKGSLWYLPPEELEPDLLRKDAQGQPLTFPPDPECRKKADIWSLGIVLYALTTGRLPFTDDFLPRLQVAVVTADYPSLPEHLSPALRDLQSQLLTVNVHERPCIEQVLQHPWLASDN